MDDDLFKAAAERALPAREVAAHLKAHKFIVEQMPNRGAARNEFIDHLTSYEQKAFDIAIYGELSDKKVKLSKHISGIKDGESRKCLALILKWLWSRNSSRAAVENFFADIKFDPATALEESKVRLSPLGEVKKLDPNRALVQSNPQVPPFDFETLILSAQSGITFIEQNQWYLVGENGKGKDYWPLLEDALRRGIAIEIVAMGYQFHAKDRPNVPLADGVELWTHYLGADQFLIHLNHCWKVLRLWMAKAQKIHDLNPFPERADLHIVSAYFSPITMTVVDRKLDDGIMVLSPRTNETNPDDRPEFVIRKAPNRSAFNSFIRYVDNFVVQHENAKTEFKLRP